MDSFHVLTSYTSSNYNPKCKEYWKCYDSCLLKNNSLVIDEFKQCMSENQTYSPGLYAKCAKESKQNCNVQNCIKNCTM
jgi:hypothetical protein